MLSSRPVLDSGRIMNACFPLTILIVIQIKMGRYIFNTFISLKRFGFLLKQASGFAFHPLFSLG